MSFQTTALKYGWVYLTALGVITGTTIYVVNNTRQQVKPEDIIPIALGTDERTMALQTGTNADGSPIYPIARPSFVRSWIKTNALVLNGTAYKVCYTSYWPSTTGVGAVQSYTSSVQPSINYASSWTATNGWVWTNVNIWPSMTVTDSYETVTNTIGWHVDRDMMVSLDTTIKALIPYYVDINTVYDGTTNIVMLTVTGLWASLGIGDKTNQFTRTPCWTNPVSTNWIVNYTSYWPSTNGTATNIVYTSDYRQVVNYAQSWTATGGHVWVTSSNWASSVVTVTNAATYGDYPWQIYVEDLQERYKVLNALKCVKLASAFDQNTSYRIAGSVFNDFGPARTWGNLQSFLLMAITIPTTNNDYWYFDGDDLPVRDYMGPTRGSAYQASGVLPIQAGTLRERGVSTGAVWRGSLFTLRMEITGPRLFGTNLTVIKSFCQQYIKETTPVDNYYFGLGENSWWGTTPHTKERVLHSYYSGDEIYTNDAMRTVKQWPSNHVFLIDFPTPVFEDVSGNTNNGVDHVIGATYSFISSDSYIFPQFNYCANKYW
jgi:hypothetical protein